MSGKPQGRKPRRRTETSAGAVGYGDLNVGTGLGQLDRGTDARATAPWGIELMWSEPDIGEARVQERWIQGPMTIGGRVSQVRGSADGQEV